MTSNSQIAPYGTWSSPITANLVSGSRVSFNEVHVNPKSGAVYLIEGRPAENGRCCIVEQQGTESIDLLPAKYNARSKVYEYGGGACLISPDGSIIFTDANTNGVFRLTSPEDVQPIIDATSKLRYADFDVHPTDNNLILAVQEDHTIESPDKVENRIVVINAKERSVEIICQGADFYLSPKFNPGGTMISWIQWDHPDMPFTGSELYVAEWKDGALGKSKHIAGKPRVEGVGQPKWHQDGTLFFTSDRTGFAQLYRLDPTSWKVEPLALAGWEHADISQKTVLMVLGNNSYTFLNASQMVVVTTKLATDAVLLVDLRTSEWTELPLGIVDIPVNSIRRVSDSKFVVIGSTFTSPSALYLIDVENPSTKVLLKSSTSIPLSPSIYSIGKHVSYPRTEGKETGGVAHAIFVPPHNPSYTPVSGTKPPVIINCHGGPTGHRAPCLDLNAQYWTTRGYAYVEVNYAGSTGYGRKYRDSLNYSWGIKDVNDSASCLAYLVKEGLVDGTKAGIVGGSAGGYTVLQSLRTFPKLWAGGNSLYGIGNLTALATGTHKFESNYLFALMFPEDTPEKERQRVYRERSPCLHVENIESPLLLLQGSLDPVVPLDQAEEMERVLKEGGKDVKLIVFEGESHGFRMQKNLKTAILEEEKLWRRTLLGLEE